MSTIASMWPPLVAALKSRAIAPERVLAAAGVQAPQTMGPLDRLRSIDVERIWHAAVDATGEETIGLDVALHVRPTSWHALGLSLQASRSLRDFSERLCGHFRFLSGDAALGYVERGDEAIIEAHRRVEHLPGASEDTYAGFLVRFIADLSLGACRPRRVHLLRSEPQDGGRRHRDFFGCPLTFGNEVHQIAFDRASADRPFPGGSEELAQHNDRLVLSYLAKLDKTDIAARVRALVIDDLASGNLSKDSVARRLHMSARTLQHKLGLRDTCFQDLVEETRQSLARAYVEDRSLSLTEISYLLGFSNTSNFSRAFKRWTGRAPGNLRRDPSARGTVRRDRVGA